MDVLSTSFGMFIILVMKDKYFLYMVQLTSKVMDQKFKSKNRSLIIWPNFTGLFQTPTSRFEEIMPIYAAQTEKLINSFQPSQ
jgi:hypothetical protein